MTDDTFYFIMHPCGDKTKIQVCDLSHVVSYQRSDWACVNDRNFSERDEAIAYARALAVKYEFTYVPFESRYDSSLNELNTFQLTPEEEAMLY